MINQTFNKKFLNRKRVIYEKSITKKHLSRFKKIKVDAFEKKKNSTAESQSVFSAKNDFDTKIINNSQIENQRDIFI